MPPPLTHNTQLGFPFFKTNLPSLFSPLYKPLSLSLHTSKISFHGGMKGGRPMIRDMVQRAAEVLMVFFLAIFSKLSTVYGKPAYWRGASASSASGSYCLSWRLGVEADNVQRWLTVPTQCLRYVENYMIGGQYEQDLRFIMDQISAYIDGISLSEDGKDAWILDVDDTCLSNVYYYKGKRYGCDPYDPTAFKSWALQEECPAIVAVLKLFSNLVDSGFKVFLVTGRDEETLGEATINNLMSQGFGSFDRLILRSARYKGQSAAAFKSEIRKQLVEEGYRIWGNVGDQWSDLQGQCRGNRTLSFPIQCTLFLNMIK